MEMPSTDEKVTFILKYSKLTFIISLFILIINLSITTLFGIVIYENWERYTSLTTSEGFLGHAQLSEWIKQVK